MAGTSGPLAGTLAPQPSEKYSATLFTTMDGQPDSYDSRNSTPSSVDITSAHPGDGTDSESEAAEVAHLAAGRLPEEVYERTLSPWRAAVRRRLVQTVEWESEIIAAMQAKVRNGFLDTYFVYTSTLGTHTFFTIFLPAIWIFGYAESARALLMVLGLGVYLSSFLKDLICSPRPFAPPVTRLTMGNHHLEYGFPSTHSTNSVSIALYLYSLVLQMYNGPEAPAAHHAGMSPTTYYVLTGLLLFYTFSIVYGRLYTGMHSFTDCVVGVLLGASICGLQVVLGKPLDTWVRTSGWIVPSIVVPACLLMVHRHPQPVDDCPCFEDAIAFVSVNMGEVVSRWYMYRNGYDEAFFSKIMPGSLHGSWLDAFTWISIAVLKMVLAILIIFTWRIFAKSLFHVILPPTFRFLAQLFTLPHRRFYTPATDYKSVPPDKGLRPIPSVIDLPGMVEIEMDGIAASTARRRALENSCNDIKLRTSGKGKADAWKSGGAGEKQDGMAAALAEYEREDVPDVIVKHYDADVLTKVFVYCGIGVIAGCGLPVMFEVLGWGVRIS
ncbi:hypothetical protein CERSUDRAFT_116813 [Gelatoporia subvermispora B]|uniref:Phosphatidic acid phosphatase type 2/haloperoxidase domain-containing protein n=1 Tax=Ceriporiopsis subvermispora (strain B) TaxID=914234 RepID=M2R875_CERS8|nr:hypothetical protein CERSUDRAFT_116813 [Gelatoporia subvermispora B]